jgi:hypothetical protein
MKGNGSGSGTGDGGNGSGYGGGYGNGYGDGDGYGDGSGSGKGYGSGDGRGSGSGNGRGYGFGDGYGSGSGYGKDNPNVPRSWDTTTGETEMDNTNFFDDFLGQKVIIRSAASGVHYGTLAGVYGTGTVVRLTDSRRLWEWKNDGPGISLSEVAIQGIDHSGSKITAVMPDLVVMDVCEIIPTYGIAQATIEGAPTAKGS